MLNNFFRINMPYGIVKNEDGDWMAFNREYMPLGYNDIEFKDRMDKNPKGLPLFTKYQKLTEKFLLDLADRPDTVKRGEDGKINLVWFYDDGSNPTNQPKDSKIVWDRYFDKIKKISKVKRDM